MENTKRIQYAIVFSIIAILAFQSVSSILQISYAYSINYLSDSNLTNRKIIATARTPSYLWVLHTTTGGFIPKISIFNATMGYVHFVTSNAVINGTGCGTFYNRIHVLPVSDGDLESIIFSCGTKLYRYSFVHATMSNPPYIGTSGTFQGSPCTTIGVHINLTPQNNIAYTCPSVDLAYSGTGHIVGIMNPQTMTAIREINLPNSECAGKPYNNYADTNQQVMVVLCFNPATGSDDSILLYDMPPIGFNLVSRMNYNNAIGDDDLGCSADLGRCVISQYRNPTGLGSGDIVFQYNLDNDIPSGNITSFGGIGSGQHNNVFVTDDSSLGSIGISGAVDDNVEVIGLNRNSTINPHLIGSILCVTSSCDVLGFGGSTSFYHQSDDEIFYFATYNGHMVGIMNITGFAQTDNDDTWNGGTTAGNSTGNSTGTTGGGTNSTGSSGTTCLYSDPSCTVVHNLGAGLCLFRLVDSTDCNIQTNGLGYILLALAIAIYVGFVWKVARKRIDSVPTFIWIIGLLSIVMAFTLMQVIDPTLLIIAIVIIVAFAVMSVKKVVGGGILNRGE